MSTELFYCGVQLNQLDSEVQQFVERLGQYSDVYNKSVYVIDKALGKDLKDSYSYTEELIILIPKQKVILLNYGSAKNEFDEFVEDFISDLEYLSKRYEYQKKIGRSRNWRECISELNFEDIKMRNIEDILRDCDVPVHKERTIELLISLLIGSINNIQSVGIDDPKTLLDKIKQKIILFDGMQSRFLYEKLDKDIIRIQGLAGTGKTELLLHKLSELYVSDKNSRLAFTCHNKVLAKDMLTRIPQFFNFMKIEEQIEWNTRLLVFSSWGSRFEPCSGLYSYICDKYSLSFYRFSDKGDFNEVCKMAISELKKIKNFEKCFDYIFIDESQDFTSNFFKMCQMVTEKKLYIAGDVFQNIFDTRIKVSDNVDYLLNKCYRTDPKTLMIAHSIGMGLYEIPVIRWLEDDEWRDCGYSLERKNKKVFLKRSPLRRFEDMDALSILSLQIKSASLEILPDRIIECIDDILKNHETVKPDDIAVIFLNSSAQSYTMADWLSFEIAKRYNWESTKGYVAKSKKKNCVFISNLNNIKGLEFPFIICVEMEKITDDLLKRNAIYMVLTRSFLCSYFVVNIDGNEKFIDIYSKAIQEVNFNGYLELREPSQDEKDSQAEKIKIAIQQRRKSLEDVLNEIFNEYPVLSIKDRNQLQDMISSRMPHDWNEIEVRKRTKPMIDACLI